MHSRKLNNPYAALPHVKTGKRRQSGQYRLHENMMNVEEYHDDVNYFLLAQYGVKPNIYCNWFPQGFCRSYLLYYWGTHHSWVPKSGSSSATNKSLARVQFTPLIHSTIISTSQSNIPTMNIDYNKQKQQEHLTKPLAQHSWLWNPAKQGKPT